VAKYFTSLNTAASQYIMTDLLVAADFGPTTKTLNGRYPKLKYFRVSFHDPVHILVHTADDKLERIWKEAVTDLYSYPAICLKKMRKKSQGTSIRTDGVPAKIQTKHHTNTSSECSC
jgi:hypothetical protein